jgi:hypothetical protein
MGKPGAKIWRTGEVEGKRYSLEGAKGLTFPRMNVGDAQATHVATHYVRA